MAARKVKLQFSDFSTASDHSVLLRKTATLLYIRLIRAFFSKIRHLPDLVKRQLLKNFLEYRAQTSDLPMKMTGIFGKNVK